MVFPADPSLAWGRLTTIDSVNHAALGLVPAWRTPVDFDLSGFLADDTDAAWDELADEVARAKVALAA